MKDEKEAFRPELRVWKVIAAVVFGEPPAKSPTYNLMFFDPSVLGLHVVKGPLCLTARVSIFSLFYSPVCKRPNGFLSITTPTLNRERATPAARQGYRCYQLSTGESVDPLGVPATEGSCSASQTVDRLDLYTDYRLGV